MRASLLATVLMLTCAGACANDATGAIYDRNPEHPWNRLYRAIATRTVDGMEYGADGAEPYFDPVDDPAKLNAVLEEFLRTNAQNRSPGSLQQALLLNDVWTAFDIAALREAAPVQRQLARVVERLLMPAAAIATLPDNYAQAVKSGVFAKDFDPAHPEVPFLPEDLLDSKGPWVEIGESGVGPVASSHVAEFSGRSAFRVFIRCPGGRTATLAYLDALNLFPTPFDLGPAATATRVATQESVRWDPLLLSASTPQFPEGTVVALVRQMVVIDDKFQPVPTPITQTVQLRVYRKIGGTPAASVRADVEATQSVYEFVLRRRDLLTGQPGGLHAMNPGEQEYRLASVPSDGSRERLLTGPVVLSTCGRCHQSRGIFSVNSYTRMLSGRTTNPQLLPSGNPDYQRAATVGWKMQQFNWGLLRGLHEGMSSRPTR